MMHPKGPLEGTTANPEQSSDFLTAACSMQPQAMYMKRRLKAVALARSLKNGTDEHWVV
jgi:hypothetical protein